jgi:hypothetical protein
MIIWPYCKVDPIECLARSFARRYTVNRKNIKSSFPHASPCPEAPCAREYQKGCIIEKWKSLRMNHLRGGAGGVVLGVTVVLASGVGKTGLVLGLAGDSVVGDAGETILALTANTLTEGGISTSGSAVTSGRLAESVVAVGEAVRDTARTNIDSAGVGGVEVRLDGRVLGLGKVAAALLDEVGLVLVGLVDDGLEIC